MCSACLAKKSTAAIAKKRTRYINGDVDVDDRSEANVAGRIHPFRREFLNRRLWIIKNGLLVTITIYVRSKQWAKNSREFQSWATINCELAFLYFLFNMCTTGRTWCHRTCDHRGLPILIVRHVRVATNSNRSGALRLHWPSFSKWIG